MTRGHLSEAFVSFQGEGAEVGRRHLFLRFAGCPLRCRYCDTPESLVRTDELVVRGRTERRLPNPLSVPDVLEAARSLLAEQRGSVDGTAVTGGEPLAQAAFLAELLSAGELPRPVLLETSGAQPEPLKRVVDQVDLVSMDLKIPSNSGETAFWGEHREFLRLVAAKVYAKLLVDEHTLEEEVRRAAALVAECAPDAPLFLQPITGAHRAVEISRRHLETLFDVAKSQIANVRVVPQTHKMIGIP